MSVIGYSYGNTMDAELVIKAIQKARSKGKFKTGAIFHSDLGSQYASNKVERYLKVFLFVLNMEVTYKKIKKCLKALQFDNKRYIINIVIF